MSTLPNVAVVHHEVRTTLTFVGIPTVETTKHLRSLGFEFDRKSRQWYRSHHTGITVEESGVISQFVE